MRVACPHCKSQYNVQDGRVPAAGANIKCPRCKNTFLVRPAAPVALSERPSESVPLPGSASPPLELPDPDMESSKREVPVPLPAAPTGRPAPSVSPAEVVPLPPPTPGKPSPIVLEESPPEPPQPALEPLGFGEVVLDDGNGAGNVALADDQFGVPLPEDPFGAAPASPAQSPRNQSPPEDAPPLELDDLDVLLDDDHRAPGDDSSNPFAEPDRPVAEKPSYRIRRPSGKIFGPFSELEVVPMLRRGELQGNEEVCLVPGDAWVAMGRVPAFVDAIRGITELAPLDDEEETARAPSHAPQLAPAANTARPKTGRRAVIAALVVVLAIAGVGVGAGFTPYGWFFLALFRNVPAGSPRVTRPVPKSGAQPSSAGDPRARLAEDRFDAIQSALASADKALSRDSKDVQAAGIYCQAAAWLELRGAAGDALGRAKTLVQDLALRAPEDPSTLQAQIALALASGSVATLGGTPAKLERHVKDVKEPDEQGLALLGDLALERKDLARASEWYQKLESAQPNARSSHKLGQLALAQGDLPAARRSFEQALARDPAHQSSAVELAALLDDPNEAQKAQLFLKAAIAADGPGRLALRERAKAHAVLAARIARARAGDRAAVPELEKELEAALQDDPTYLSARLQYARMLLRNGAPDRAAALLSSTPGEASQSAEVIALSARALSASDRLLDAVTLVDGGLAKSPGAALLLFAKGEVLEQDSKRKEALKLYQDAVERDPALWEARVALGRAALRDGDLARAEKALRLALEKAPGEAEPYAELGNLEIARNGLDKAEQAYRKALSLDPGHVGAQLGLARVLLTRGDQNGAQAALGRALELDPRLTEGHLLLGALLFEKRDLAGAQKAYEAAVAADPRNALAHARLGEARFQQGQVDAALAELKQSVDLDLTIAESHHWLGRALLSKGEKAQALDQLGRAVQLAPDNASYHLHVGIARESLNALQDAIDSYRVAIAKDPKLVEAYERTGLLFGSQNHCKEALPFLEKALELAPGLQRLRVELGDCKAKLGKQAEAVQLYRQAQKADPRLTGVDYKIARALHESSGIGAALPVYEKAAREDGANPMPHYYLGYAYKERGQKARAVQEFKVYLKLKPDAEDRRDIEQEIEYLGGKP